MVYNLSTFMNVTKYVVLWSNLPLHSVKKLKTTGPVTPLAQVPMTKGRAVCHQNVYPLWDKVPFLLTRQTSFQVKRPTVEFWLPAIRI